MPQALRRGVAALQARLVLPRLPEWLLEPDFVSARAAADPWEVGDLVRALQAAERQLRLCSAGRCSATGPWFPSEVSPETPALPAWAADDDEAQKRMVVALGRLALGAAVEAAFVEETLDRCAPGAVVARGGEPDAAVARLYHDAYLVSVWTSAHAQYVSYVQSGVEEPPPPGIHSVPSAATDLDLSDLFARRTCQRQCPKAAAPLLQILCRCTNPGSRGWDTLLDSALGESTGARSIVAGAMVVALSALHPHLHPALRPPWPLRMRTMRVAAHRLTDSESRAQLVATAPATKEGVRRLLATAMAASPASHAAFAHVSHPVGLLTSPPVALPARGMEGAMASFVRAGLVLADPAGPLSYAAAVNGVFVSEGAEASGGPEWEPPWLGACICAPPCICALPCIHQKVALPLTHTRSLRGRQGHRQHPPEGAPRLSCLRRLGRGVPHQLPRVLGALHDKSDPRFAP